MKLTTDRIAALAGYRAESTESSSAPSFGLKNEDSVKTACIEIAQAGVPIDMEYFMGIYYFNFKTKKAYDKAVGVVSKKLDLKDETEFKPKKG